MSGSALKLKKKNVRVKHQKAKLFRANEPLLSVFMWGVNHSVSISLLMTHFLVIRKDRGTTFVNIFGFCIQLENGKRYSAMILSWLSHVCTMSIPINMIRLKKIYLYILYFLT